MKKVLCLLLSIVLLATGCGVSRTEYESLKKRVDALEAQINGSESNVPSNTPASASQNANAHSTSGENSNSEIECSYPLQNMSAEDIFQELCFYFEHLPTEGESYDDIEASLKAKPFSRFYSRFSFLSDYEAGSGLDMRSSKYREDCIVGLEFMTRERMDGTASEGSYAMIVLLLTDFEKASSLYDLLYDYLTPRMQALAPETDRFGNSRYYSQKEGTSWYAHGPFTNGNTSYDLQYLSLEKYGNYYYLTVCGL